MRTAANRALAAKATLARDREELRAAWLQLPGRDGSFPRSKTFRWLGAHVKPGAVASGLMTALFWRRPLLVQLLRTLTSRGR